MLNFFRLSKSAKSVADSKPEMQYSTRSVTPKATSSTSLLEARAMPRADNLVPAEPIVTPRAKVDVERARIEYMETERPPGRNLPLVPTPRGGRAARGIPLPPLKIPVQPTSVSPDYTAYDNIPIDSGASTPGSASLSTPRQLHRPVIATPRSAGPLIATVEPRPSSAAKEEKQQDESEASEPDGSGNGQKEAPSESAAKLLSPRESLSSLEEEDEDDTGTGIKTVSNEIECDMDDDELYDLSCASYESNFVKLHSFLRGKLENSGFELNIRRHIAVWNQTRYKEAMNLKSFVNVVSREVKSAPKDVTDFIPLYIVNLHAALCTDCESTVGYVYLFESYHKVYEHAKQVVDEQIFTRVWKRAIEYHSCTAHATYLHIYNETRHSRMSLKKYHGFVAWMKKLVDYCEAAHKEILQICFEEMLQSRLSNNALHQLGNRDKFTDRVLPKRRLPSNEAA